MVDSVILIYRLWFGGICRLWIVMILGILFIRFVVCVMDMLNGMCGIL